MVKITFNSSSCEDTMDFAAKLSTLLNKGDVLIMDATLGAGKTVFAKGIGKGLEVKDTIISPTFNIVRCYFEGRIPFYHIDAYRLEGTNSDIGLDEYLYGDGICLIEWAEYISNILPKTYLKVSILIKSDNERIYTLESNSDYYDAILKEISNEL